MLIPFTKMHGLGNDFVIVDKRYLAKTIDFALLAQTVLERNTGIGGDQFIIYEQLQNSFSNYEMQIYNPDGSLAKACGNGARCVAKLIYTNHGSKSIILKILDRITKCNIDNDHRISINMGRANFDAVWMPTTTQITSIANNYSLKSGDIICVDMGNPHLVIFSSLEDERKQILGNELSNSDMFHNDIDNSGKANINFARVAHGGSKIYLEVFERNTGF
ncbi:MAG: diaminopimelate epimerase, partial [Janthinobacterium lividum]